MNGDEPDMERSAEDERWREAVSAHYALAGHLAAAALSLEQAATSLDPEGDSLYVELAEIFPAEGSDESMPPSDRDFLLDRALTHREKAVLFARNGGALAEAMTRNLRRQHGGPDSWERRYALREAMCPYAESIGCAATEAERILVALDASLSERGVTEPAAQMAAVVRFLNLEAALFAALIEEDAGHE